MTNANNSTALSTGTVPAADREVTGDDNKPVIKLTDSQKEAIDKAMQSLSDSLADIVTPELDAILVAIDAAKKEVDAGPFKLLRWMKESVPDEKLAMFPTPGSEAGYSENPDKYEEAYFRDGKKKFRKTSFYLRFFLRNVPEGKRIAATLAHIALAKDEKANQAAVPENIRNLNPVDLENLREDTVSQQNRGVKALRDAVGLMKQFDAVNALPKVACAPLMDDAGNVRKTNKPIKVWSTENPEMEWSLYSIQGFMQFDPAKAAELAGDLASLKLTAKREQGEDDEVGGDKPQVINTIGTLTARMVDVHEFIVNKMMSDPKRELYGMFLKELSGAGSDDLIETIDDIGAFCRKITTIPAIAARLEAISQRPAKDAA